MGKFEMTSQLHYCPNHCDGAQFYATAHVVQDWKVSATGTFLEEVGTSEVTHSPDADDVWQCSECGAEARCVECNVYSDRLGGTDDRAILYYVEHNPQGGEFPLVFLAEDGTNSFALMPVQKDDLSSKLYFTFEDMRIDLT